MIKLFHARSLMADYLTGANSKIINCAVSSPMFSTDIKFPDSQNTSPAAYVLVLPPSTTFNVPLTT